MAFEIYRTNRTVSGQSSNVIADYNYSTGGQFIAKAFQDAGKDLMELGKYFDTLEAESQLSESQRLASMEYDKFSIGLESNLDPSTYGKKLEETISKMSAYTPKNRIAKRQYQNWINGKTAQWNEDVSWKMIGRQKDNWFSEFFQRQADAEIGTDVEGFERFLATGYAEGMIKKKDASKILINTRLTTQYNEGIQALEDSPELFLEKIDDPNYLPRLDAGTRRILKTKANTEIGTRQAQARQEKEQIETAEQNRLLNLARQGKLTNALIRASKLEPFGLGSKDTFYKMLDAGAEAELKKKENPYLKSDPQTKAVILQMLRDPNVNITANDITRLMGKGLSINDATSIVNDIDVYKSFWFKRADSYMKGQLGWSDSLTRFAHPQGGLAYSLAMNELFDAIEKEKVRGRDLLDRAMLISTPFLMDYWENVLMYKGEQLEQLKKMLNLKAQPAPGRPPSEEAKKAKEKSEIDPQGIFK